MRCMKLVPVMVLLSIALCSMMFVPGKSSAAITDLELVPGKYTGTSTYVPGEIMSIIVSGDASEEGERFEVYSVLGTEVLVTGGIFVMPEDLTVKITYEVPDVPDGTYSIRIRRSNGAIEAEVPFTVQGYVFTIETDRKAYLSSDELRVFWTANNLKDQTLPASGVGRIDVWTYDPANPANADPLHPLVVSRYLEPHLFNTSAGSVSFKIPPIVNYSMEYYVDGWFNNSYAPVLRSQYSRASFNITKLGVIISLDKDQYTASSLLSLTVRTLATDNPANPLSTDGAEPECNVSIAIGKIGEINTVYGPIILRTDSQGVLKHIIALNSSAYVDGAVFTLEVYAYKGTTNTVTDSQTFEIVSSSSISIVLDFSKAQYASGETLFVNSTASSIGGSAMTNFTYILEIRASSPTGSLFARSTQLQGSFAFAIPSNFEGWLWLRVTADDGAGNSASVEQLVSVAYAVVLVNADREYYNSGDVLTVTFSVIGNMEASPSTFYVIYDGDGSVVEEGAAAQGSFGFTVPGAPSDTYRFVVFASAAGRVVQGNDSAYLYSGYLLNLDFNRNYYAPGDVIAVDYSIIVLGNTNTPSSFSISYGLINGPMLNLQTAQTSGTLIYTIPEDVDQGDQIFMATCDFGATEASATEVLLVRSGTNPLWYLRINDLPLFSIGVLMLSLLALYSSYRTRKRVKMIEKEGLIRPSEREQPAAKRQSEAAGNSVECVECGNPIEIATTRRPIEVMCPHCGEIQHLEK